MNFAPMLIKRLTVALMLWLPMAGLSAVEKQPKDENLSLKKEVQHSIDAGLDWLRKNQQQGGHWSSEETPAMTALVLLAFKGEPAGKFTKSEPEFIRQGYAYLESCVQENGSIYRKKELLTHNTALSTLAFVAANKSKYDATIKKSRAFLIGLQTDFDQKGKTDNIFDGGVGYGSKYEHSDMANTLSALEAIYYSKPVAQDGAAPGADLNWTAAIQFLQNCQNLPSHNQQAWASADPKDQGGFVYYPGHSMAGGETNADGRVALRSYGSASYAGLLSYIYADLKRDDPRVKGVYDWLRSNYTLEENPGMGAQGLYYYFHTMAKALSTLKIDTIEVSAGKQVNWKKDLSLRLINLQKPDGSWANDNGRWWEKDAVLVTSYAVISLELILRHL